VSASREEDESANEDEGEGKEEVQMEDERSEETCEGGPVTKEKGGEGRTGRGGRGKKRARREGTHARPSRGGE